MQTSELYEKRLAVVEDAIALKESEWLPVVPMFSATPYFLYGGAYKDSMYNYDDAIEKIVQLFDEFKPDAMGFSGTQFTSGIANEVAGTAIIDWPGRPGTVLRDTDSHQFIDDEYMLEDEYGELLRDFTGFMLRKYIPRVYKNLTGFENLSFSPFSVMSTKPLAPLYSPEFLQAMRTIEQVGELDRKAAEMTQVYRKRVEELGFPPMQTTGSQAPFDILGDYFRGTMGMFDDQLEQPENVAAACEMFADILIDSYKKFDFSKSRVKRVLFPLHKGMDSFMSPDQYENLYWKSLKRVMLALIDMGVTPFIYAEGDYNTRLEQLADIPPGKVIYHFENVDMERAKKIVGKVACISGNIPNTLLEFGTPEQVSDYTKRLIDTCAPGGGYILDTGAFIDNVKRENLEIMFDVCRTYGRK